MSCINHEYKHVFIHVPKTGGTSMERMPFVGGKDHAPISDFENPGGYFTWGFVRNPFDRLVSFHAAATQHHPTLDCVPSEFREFVHALPDIKHIYNHTRTQAYFLCGEAGDIGVEFVGRFEQMRQDWQVVCERISGHRADLPHTNASTHRPWREMYDAETAAVIADTYDEDFRLFGYDGSWRP